MKKIILIASVVILGLAVSSCNFNFYGSSSSTSYHGEVMVSDTVYVEDFEALSAFASEAVYIQGDENKVVYEACEPIADKIEVKVKDRKLCLGVDGDNNGHKFKCTIMGRLPLNTIDVSGNCKLIYNGDIKHGDVDIDCSGASNIKVNGVVCAKDIDIDMSGASQLSLNIDCQELSIDVSGASNAQLDGKAINADLDASGASLINAKDLEIVNLSAEASGVSRISAIASGRVKISESGVSTIKVQNK